MFLFYSVCVVSGCSCVYQRKRGFPSLWARVQRQLSKSSRSFWSLLFAVVVTIDRLQICWIIVVHCLRAPLFGPHHQNPISVDNKLRKLRMECNLIPKLTQCVLDVIISANDMETIIFIYPPCHKISGYLQKIGVFSLQYLLLQSIYRNTTTCRRQLWGWFSCS